MFEEFDDILTIAEVADALKIGYIIGIYFTSTLYISHNSLAIILIFLKQNLSKKEEVHTIPLLHHFIITLWIHPYYFYSNTG